MESQECSSWRKVKGGFWVSYEDVEQLRPYGVLDNTRVPHFMKDLERYRQQLEHIMTTNRLDEAELGRLLPD